MKIYDKKLAYPYFVWMVLFTVVPLFIVVYYAMTDAEGNFTLNNLTSISGYGSVFARSLLLALIATVICLVIAFPVGYFLSRLRVNKQHIMLMLVMLPMWMNFLLRTFAWMTILENNGLINKFLGLFGIGPLQMINTQGAIVLGMVYNFLPFMIYPIYNTLQKMDRSLIEAAQDLGANPLQVFGKVILPLSMPGIMSGIVMVFMPTVSTFAIAELLTMNNIKLFGTTVQENIYNGMWNYGAALSLIMLLLIGVTILFTNEEDGASNESGGVI